MLVGGRVTTGRKITQGVSELRITDSFTRSLGLLVMVRNQLLPRITALSSVVLTRRMSQYVLFAPRCCLVPYRQ